MLEILDPPKEPSLHQTCEHCLLTVCKCPRTQQQVLWSDNHFIELAAQFDDIIQQAADLAKGQANPITDMRGTVEQRIHLAGVLSKRAINGAVQRAKES